MNYHKWQTQLKIVTFIERFCTAIAVKLKRSIVHGDKSTINKLIYAFKDLFVHSLWLIYMTNWKFFGKMSTSAAH